MIRVHGLKTRWILIGLFLLSVAVTPSRKAQAQVPVIEIIKFATKKVIRAIDLKIQKQQNKVIWLQNAQKTLENTMSKLKLKEIADWTERQRKLYDEYFLELRKVKTILFSYQKVKDIIRRQLQMVEEYKQAWNLLQNDKHFTQQELVEMYRVYAAILDESMKNLDQLFLVINSFQTQMSDGKRLELINTAGDNLQRNLVELRGFNQRNFSVSVSRATNEEKAVMLKKIYGLE